MWLLSDDPDAQLELGSSFDVEAGGWVIELCSPEFEFSHRSVYSRVMVPLADFERGDETALTDLFMLHVNFLGVR
jgi:hypothetical protein